MIALDTTNRHWVFVNACEALPDEAPSSWVARLAHAHRLRADELMHLHSTRPAALDLGLAKGVLDEVSAKTGGFVAPAPHPVVRALADVGWLPQRAASWAASDWWGGCRRCLAEDQATGRPLHVRAAWVHPFAFVCVVHRCWLTPWLATIEVQLADGSCRFAAPSPESMDGGPVPPAVIELAAALEAPHQVGSWAAVAAAMMDLVDALCTRTGPNGSGGAALRLFVDRHAIPAFLGSSTLLNEQLAGLDGLMRVVALRTAAELLCFDPAYSQPEPPPWLAQAVFAGRRGGGRRSLYGASADPLFLLAMHLAGPDVDSLSRRAVGWPAELRSRMSAAVVVGALASFA